MLKESLRRHLLRSHAEEELKRWFDPLRLELSREERVVRVLFPHGYFAAWFRDGPQGVFERELGVFLGPGYGLSYQNLDLAGQADGRAAPTPRSEIKRLDFPWGRQFTFETYLHNRKNLFPLSAAREVAGSGEATFNPFIVSGEHGSGKTHLLRAVANELAKRHDHRQIWLGSVEDLSAAFAGFPGDNLAARSYLYGFSFLVVDDFQLIRAHAQLQEELIHIFNHFHDNRKQMIIACADKIASCDFLDPSLKSRLEGGLVVNLKRPDLDVRVKYVLAQSKLKKLGLTKEQSLTLAQRFEDFRRLQGVLLKLFAYRELEKKDIGEGDFEQVLSHTVDERSEETLLKPEVILETVAARFGQTVKDLLGSRRTRDLVAARQAAMYLCRQLLGCSYPQLGRIFGGKDHSTVIYAVKKVEELQASNKEMKSMLSELKKSCLSLDGNRSRPGS